MAEVEKPAAEDLTSKVQDLDLEEKSGNDESISSTVFKSIEDFSVVHPLSHKWTFWYTKPSDGSEDWHMLLKEVVTVSTVEEFWGAYNSIPKVSDLPLKADYSFFRSGIRPEWEDPHNAKGGKWLYQFRANKRSLNIDEIWLKVLLGMIGGTLDNEIAEQEEINGAFVSVRKAGIKVNLWTKNTSQDLLRNVGLRFKEILGLGDRDEVEFSAHESGRGKAKVTL